MIERNKKPNNSFGEKVQPRHHPPRRRVMLGFRIITPDWSVRRAQKNNIILEYIILYTYFGIHILYCIATAQPSRAAKLSVATTTTSLFEYSLHSSSLTFPSTGQKASSTSPEPFRATVSSAGPTSSTKLGSTTSLQDYKISLESSSIGI